jgi:hypothetical protein
MDLPENVADAMMKRDDLDFGWPLFEPSVSILLP